MAGKSVVIQKFGGSSLITLEQRNSAAALVEEIIQEGNAPVIVVSAMGRKPDPYATDSLIQVMDKENENRNLRELDLAVSCGETISSAVMAARLQSLGYDAVALTGPQAGIMTDENYTEGEITTIDPQQVQNYINNDQIVVVAGFQGVSANGNIVTLGRGGSDITATAIAGYLGAERVEIYTDVDGLMTVDPKEVPEAKAIDVITYYEVLQMAKEGAKVIHPRAVEYAMQYAVPIYIKNIKNPRENGTKITHHIKQSINKNQIITGITHLRNINQITLEMDYDCSQDLKVDVFQTLGSQNISLDMINIYEDKLMFTVKEKNITQTLQLLKNRGFGKVYHRSDCTKITLFGTRMTGLPGVIAKAIEILNEEQIEVLQTTDSNITISCLIDGKDTQDALRALHKGFDLSD